MIRAIQNLMLITVMALLPLSASAQGNSPKGLTLSNKAFTYKVADYHICIRFNSENSLTWTYLSAPNNNAGKTATEQFDRKNIRHNQVLAAWTEKDGTHVTDLFDFNDMKLYASFVMPNDQRFLSVAEITLVNHCKRSSNS